MSLIMSVWNNEIQTLKTLIARGADVNAVDRHGRTALWYASEGIRIECATALIDAKADVNKASENGYTPLHRASYYGRAECVRLLIKHKADMNALCLDGGSPLHLASLGNLTCVQILVASGAENDQPDNDGDTPLAVAIERNHPSVAEFLLHSGAKMKNVKPTVHVPPRMLVMIAKRQLIMSFTLALKGLLRRRLALSKDATHLIALYFWSMRIKVKDEFD